MLVEGEPDARPMGIGPGRKPPSYNLQAAVDIGSWLIVHHDVTSEPTDNRLLHPMAKATKDSVGADTLTVVADAGYSNGADAVACKRDGITPCVPANRATNNQGDGTLFDRSLFDYDSLTDSYRCPAGRTLVRKQSSGGTIAFYMPRRTVRNVPQTALHNRRAALSDAPFS